MRIIRANNNQEAIATAFSELLQQYQQNKSQIATKEEEIAKTQNQVLLVKTRDYTVDNIVNGMAALQLSFGNIVGELAEELTSESDKLQELRKAIAIEGEHLERLKQVRLVADALYLLNQEHQAKKATLQANTTQIREAIDCEILQTKKKWSIEEIEFANKLQEAAESSIQQRELEAADYQYELARQRTIEQDQYETDQRLQGREIAELEAAKAKDWSRREKYLAEHKAEFAQHQEAIANFETQLKEEYGKAKGKAIKDAEQKYQVATELKEKEWAAMEQGYGLKIASLTTIVEHQTEQVAEITRQLQEANAQAQNLAMQAFQNQ
ncbi:MAG: hypothetical protein RLZZ74_429 [Cyanobacteriota bacterium]